VSGPTRIPALVLAVAAAALAGAGPAAAAPSAQILLQHQISPAPELPESCLVAGAGAATTDMEPQIAVDPADPRHMASIWSVFQPGAFFPRAARVAVTWDGGRTWRHSLQQGVDSCTGNPEYSASGGHNPTVAFGPEGRLYVESQSGTPEAPGFGAESLFVSVSEDGGETWLPTVSPIRHSRTFGIADQVSMVADRGRPGTVYLMSQVSDPNRYVVSHTLTGKAYFTRSDDGGRTWTPPALAYAPPGLAGRAPFGNSVQRLPDGTLLDIFAEVNGSGALTYRTGQNYANRIYAIRSRDGGETWSVPVPVVDQIAEYPAQPLVTDPDGHEHWGVDAFMPPAQYAADGRTIYLAYAAHASDGSPQSTLHVMRSDDGGATWTETAPPTPSNAAFMPALAIAGDGTVGMTWIDLREQRPGLGIWPARVWFAHSSDGGRTWSERPLTDTMDLASQRPRLDGNAFVANAGAGAIFLAEHNGLAGLPNGGFAAVYPVLEPRSEEGPTSIEFARIATTPSRPGE
jgi:outer membrane protein assembly factor BamB